MSKVRICFLGTPDFAVESLKALLGDEHYEVVGVITQPDRPAGRKLILTPSPVKQFALGQNLQVLSPESLKNNKLILDQVKVWAAEVAVVVAFGQILSEEFFKIFPFGCVNLHASILPRWRGAAPIQRAIEFGDRETGVTLQKMVKKLDAGDVIGYRKIKIEEGEDAKSLFSRLALLGTDLLHVELMDYIRGNLVPSPQDESQVTYAHKIEKTEALIDWRKSAIEIDQKIRAFSMGPGTYTFYDKKMLKIHLARAHSDENSILEKVKESSKSDSVHFDKKLSTPEAIALGAVVFIGPESIGIKTGSGILEIFEVQPESRARLKVSEFLKGHLITLGVQLG